MKNKNHIFMSINAEKALVRIQHLVTKRTLNKVGTERT